MMKTEIGYSSPFRVIMSKTPEPPSPIAHHLSEPALERRKRAANDYLISGSFSQRNITADC